MKVSTDNITATLAYCEAHCDNEDEERFLEWITEHLSDALKAEHPRFDHRAFMAAAMPTRSRLYEKAAS